MNVNPRPISDQTWQGTSTEFTLSALGQVRRRLCELMDDPEPVMREFVHEGTFCPGFHFLHDGQMRPTAMTLFQHGMELQIPHNYFTLWTVTPPETGSDPAPLTSSKPARSPAPRAQSLRWR